jgi:hypothetical protein
MDWVTRDVLISIISFAGGIVMGLIVREIQDIYRRCKIMNRRKEIR